MISREAPALGFHKYECNDFSYKISCIFTLQLRSRDNSLPLSCDTDSFYSTLLLSPTKKLDPFGQKIPTRTLVRGNTKYPAKNRHYKMMSNLIIFSQIPMKLLPFRCDQLTTLLMCHTETELSSQSFDPSSLTHGSTLSAWVK